MDMITTIETALRDVLLTIDGSTLASGYEYYNTITNVNIEDEAVVDSYPALCIYLDPEETINSGNQRAYMNTISLRIVGRVILDTEESFPNFAINAKMNELLSDIKACISNNYHLNDTCDLAMLKSSSRQYTTTGDNYRAGDLIVRMTIQYNQSRTNPNNRCPI